MVDTRDVFGARFFGLATMALAAAGWCEAQAPPTWADATARAVQQTPQARIVVLDMDSGRLLAAKPLLETARTLAAPGSTLKPLALYGLVVSGRWAASRRIACTRKLSVAGRSLNCSHPAAEPMNARQALAWSCNTYFAEVASSLAPGALRNLLAPSGVLGQTGLAANEAIAEFREPRSADDNRLALLGVEGVRVTPFELAAAYRWLALQIAAHPESLAAEVVAAGLGDSASFGMGGAAALGGVPVAGKTGTANTGAGSRSHGWFVGWAPAGQPQVVIAVYVPSGRGANAARLVADLLAHSPLHRTKP